MMELAFSTVCFFAQNIEKLWEGILSPGCLADTADFLDLLRAGGLFLEFWVGVMVRDYVGPGRVS